MVRHGNSIFGVPTVSSIPRRLTSGKTPLRFTLKYDWPLSRNVFYGWEKLIVFNPTTAVGRISH